MKESNWCENVILVDADYVDSVAFDLTVNFERMIGRRIPKADMAVWLECVALDGGMRPAEAPAAGTEGLPAATTQVVLLHAKGRTRMDNFVPGDYAKELDGKAFSGRMGEFLISCVPVEEMVTAEDMFIDSMQVITNSSEVRRAIIVPNAERIYNKVKEGLRHADDQKHITVLTMQPMAGGNYRQEILGYSLMAALGIRSDEIKD